MPRSEVRLLKTIREFRACEGLQAEVWGAAGATSELLIVTQKCGGVVLGAFAGRKLVGFLFAFLGRRKGRLIHWSHMMAVREGYRDRGVGFRMKLAHRKLALAQGIKSICWTFDPLQSRNAALNIARLGASVDEYVVDCYGRFPSAIEKGLPSDRLVVDWRIDSTSVRRPRKVAPQRNRADVPRANETRVNASGLLETTRIRLGLRAPRLLVEIPPHTDAIRAADSKLALRWRMDIRRIFQNYLRAGYGIADFLPPTARPNGRCFYVMTRDKPQT